MINIEDKIKGALFGVAIGDALGAPLEFMDKKQIQHKYGTVDKMIGGGCLDVEPGEITDDTQMTIAVAKGIVESPDEPEPYIGKYFIDWLKTDPKDVGRTCRTSIQNAYCAIQNVPSLSNSNGVAPYIFWSDASKANALESKRGNAGNGALMRTVYPGLYYPNEGQAVHVADRISRMTHWDEKSAEACRLYTKLIHYLITNANLKVEEKINGISDMLANTRYDNSIIPKVPEPSGYVVNSFYCALHCLYHTEDLKSAIVMAVNMGGDTDTIGAITGGLAGALYGFSRIPVIWYAQLDDTVKQTLSNLTEKAVENRDH